MVKLYTTDCPRCRVVEQKLHKKNISFEKVTDFNVDDFIEKGFTMMPILEVDGRLYDYSATINYINEVN